MTTATITKTKEYLLIKIPLKNLAKEQDVSVFSEDEKAVHEGLKALAEGRVSKKFKTARSATAFLRKL